MFHQTIKPAVFRMQDHDALMSFLKTKDAGDLRRAMHRSAAIAWVHMFTNFCDVTGGVTCVPVQCRGETSTPCPATFVEDLPTAGTRVMRRKSYSAASVQERPASLAT